ncbi:unnamed protein product [Fasciola hepatica]|uniref:Uncharacterized protein n=1 Tax=Fasciola hepatica TaxID=6192 RepID=A0ABC9HJ07_FASHE
MGLGIGITGFRQRNIPNLRPTVCRLRRNDVKESAQSFLLLSGKPNIQLQWKLAGKWNNSTSRMLCEKC